MEQKEKLMFNFGPEFSTLCNFFNKDSVSKEAAFDVNMMI